MGPPFFDGGNLTTEKRFNGHRESASMGPPFFDGGNTSIRHRNKVCKDCFNGAAVF